MKLGLGYAVLWQNILSVTVPASPLRHKGEVPIQSGEVTADHLILGTDMKIVPFETGEHWQEYRTKNGWVVKVRPEVERVVRLQTYSQLANSDMMEPYYTVTMKMKMQSQAATSIRGIDSIYTIKEGKQRLETENFWAEFKVKKDERRGDQYIDVLIGDRNHTAPHSHMGINFDQSTRFVEPRERLNTMRHEIDSKLQGRLADNTIMYSEPRKGKPVGRLTFQVIIDDSTKTITPKFEEARLQDEGLQRQRERRSHVEAVRCFG